LVKISGDFLHLFKEVLQSYVAAPTFLKRVLDFSEKVKKISEEALKHRK